MVVPSHWSIGPRDMDHFSKKTLRKGEDWIAAIALQAELCGRSRLACDAVKHLIEKQRQVEWHAPNCPEIIGVSRTDD